MKYYEKRAKIKAGSRADNSASGPVSVGLTTRHREIAQTIADRKREGKAAPPQPPLNSADAYVDRGIRLCKQGFLDAAIADFDAAIRLDSAKARAYHNRGVARFLANRPQDAITDFNAAIHLQPSLGVAYANRGLAYAMLGNREKAADDYREASSLGVAIESDK
jgi:tetratricopeptide (TPR) repeat protein